MKRPSFQFYPADWRTNTNLRRCSEAARGIWMDVLCTLHVQEEYGIVRWPLQELAQVAGVALKLLRELVEKSVLKGADKGRVTYIHTPRHAGKAGEPVTLIDTEGPCWFSSRMVRDEWRRSVSGGPTRYSADNQAVASNEAKPSPRRSPSQRQGDGLGDGASTSSSSSASEEQSSLRSDCAPSLPGVALDVSQPKTAKKRAIPELFPGQNERRWAQEFWRGKGRDDLVERVDEEADQFRDHHAKEGSKLLDWPAGWRTWARNALKFSRPPANANRNESVVLKVVP